VPSRAPRSSIDDLRALVAYDRAVYARFVRRIRRLPWRTVTRKRGIGHESLFATLVHILHPREVWLAYIVWGRNSDAEIEALFGDARRQPKNWKEFDAYAKRVWAATLATLDRLKPQDLDRRISIFWMPGAYTVRDAFFQASYEEAHHLGEIIGALWQDDVEPPAMTWIDVRRGRS
jgi:uncharacterized damage-inducible protein DinB